MDLRSLRHFVAIAETLSFSRAAQALKRSQPGLSRSIRELEAELGLELFERVGRRISLRPEGELLLERAQRLLADADGLAEEARRLAGGTSFVLRVGGASNTLARVMPEVLRRYRRKWSNVDVQLRTSGGADLLTALERGDLDVGIGRTTDSDLLRSTGAFLIHVVAVVHRGHRLAARRVMAVADLEAERLLVPPPTFSSRLLVDAAFAGEGLHPRYTLETENLHALVALAEAEQGVALVPSIFSTEGRPVAVVPLRHAGRALSSSTGLVWARRRTPPPHMAAFIGVAADYVRSAFPR